MFEKVLSLFLSKHCKNGLRPCKKKQDVPFLRVPVYTSAQGQGRGTKCRPSSLKIRLCHSSASLCETPPLTATATYLYPKMPLEQGRLPAGQGQDCVGPVAVLHRSVRAVLVWGAGVHLRDTALQRSRPGHSYLEEG